MPTSLPVLNLKEATFECTFGRGCDGICCKNGRPSVDPKEKAQIAKALKKALPHLRPAARELIEAEGFVSKRVKLDGPMLRVIDGWCVFFNEGCVLHKIGAIEGDKYKYKPSQCVLFPLAKDEQDRWYVRQHGVKGEVWDLFCLSPDNSRMPAAKSLAEELAFAENYSD